MKLNSVQRKKFDEWMNTSNYVFNKTVELTSNGHKPNFYDLRNILVTENTKKNNKEYIDIENKIKEFRKQKKDAPNKKIIDEEIKKCKEELKTVCRSLKSSKNTNICNEWEFDTPKDIRAGAVNDVCKAYKTAFTNLKNGNIKHFKLNFRKKTSCSKSFIIPSTLIKIHTDENKNQCFRIAPNYLYDNCKVNIGRRTLKKHKNLSIENDCRIVKKNREYFIFVPITVEKKEKTTVKNYCGIDPGVRTFMTSFGNEGVVEYKHNSELLKKLNDKISSLKTLKKRKGLCKYERKKEHIVDELHWKTINNIISSNDVIFYGDIKSHNIVKKGKIKSLNKNFNDLKFYVFRERLLYKASLNSKMVIKINEAFTTKTCSCCGTMKDVGSSKTYECDYCKAVLDRDFNASKNILMKGIITEL
jgi:transposase